MCAVAKKIKKKKRRYGRTKQVFNLFKWKAYFIIYIQTRAGFHFSLCMLENVRGVIDYSLLLVLFSIFLSQKLQTLDTQDKCKKVQAECSQTRSLHTHTQRNVCKYSGYTSAMNIRSILPSETEFAGQRTLSRTTLSGLILATWTHPTAQYYTWTFMRIHSPLSQICVLFSIFFFSYSHQTRFDLFIRIHFLFEGGGEKGAIKVNNNIPAINISSSLPGTSNGPVDISASIWKSIIGGNVHSRLFKFKWRQGLWLLSSAVYVTSIIQNTSHVIDMSNILVTMSFRLHCCCERTRDGSWGIFAHTHKEEKLTS